MANKINEFELNKVYCGDCLKLMKKFPDNSVDIVITSPPYNIGKSVRGNLYEGYSDDLTQEEYKEFISNTLKDLIRITKYYVFFNFQILKTNKLAYLEILNEFKKNIKEIIIWNKKQVAPASQPTCLSSKFEFIIVLCKEELAINRSFERAFFNNRKKGKINSNVIEGNNMSSAKELDKKNQTNKHSGMILSD